MMKPARPKFSTNDKPSGLHEDLPYEPQGSILSAGELRFYNQGLRPAIGKRFHIIFKPRLADVVHCPSEHWRSGAGARIASRHLDFLLVKPHSTKIVCAIELDDASHCSPEQTKIDRFKDDVLLACQVPLIRIPIYKRYDAKRLRRMIFGTLKRHPARMKRRVEVAWR